MNQYLIRDIESNERIIYDFKQLKSKGWICSCCIILLGLTSYSVAFIYLIKQEDGSL